MNCVCKVQHLLIRKNLLYLQEMLSPLLIYFFVPLGGDSKQHLPQMYLYIQVTEYYITKLVQVKAYTPSYDNLWFANCLYEHIYRSIMRFRHIFVNFKRCLTKVKIFRLNTTRKSNLTLDTHIHSISLLLAQLEM